MWIQIMDTDHGGIHGGLTPPARESGVGKLWLSARQFAENEYANGNGNNDADRGDDVHVDTGFEAQSLEPDANQAHERDHGHGGQGADHAISDLPEHQRFSVCYLSIAEMLGVGIRWSIVGNGVCTWPPGQ